MQGVTGFCFGSFNFEAALATRDGDIQVRLDAPQMRLHGAAQVRQAGVVQGGEGVFQNQVDNP